MRLEAILIECGNDRDGNPRLRFEPTSEPRNHLIIIPVTREEAQEHFKHLYKKVSINIEIEEIK